MSRPLYHALDLYCQQTTSVSTYFSNCVIVHSVTSHRILLSSTSLHSFFFPQGRIYWLFLAAIENHDHNYLLEHFHFCSTDKAFLLHRLLQNLGSLSHLMVYLCFPALFCYVIYHLLQYSTIQNSSQHFLSMYIYTTVSVQATNCFPWEVLANYLVYAAPSYLSGVHGCTATD